MKPNERLTEKKTQRNHGERAERGKNKGPKVLPAFLKYKFEARRTWCRFRT